MKVEFNSQSGVAFARLVATLLVSVLATFGWTFDSDLVFNVLLSVIAVALFVYSWWKNNNVTEAAQEAQKVLDQLKVAEKVEEDVEKKAVEAAKEAEAAGEDVTKL